MFVICLPAYVLGVNLWEDASKPPWPEVLPPHFSSSGSGLGPPSNSGNWALGTGSVAFRVGLVVPHRRK